MCLIPIEEEYDMCFDWPFIEAPGTFPPDTFQEMLEHLFNAKAVDHWRLAEARGDFFELFRKWHEEGLVRPMTDEEKEERDNRIRRAFDMIERDNQWYKEYDIIGLYVD